MYVLLGVASDILLNNVTTLLFYFVSKYHGQQHWNNHDYTVSTEYLLVTSHFSNRKLLYFYIMMTSSNGNIFRVTGPLCGEFTGPGEFPAQRPVTRRFDVFFDLSLNKRLSKQPWGWWFETPAWSLRRHRNDKWQPRGTQSHGFRRMIA